MVEEAGGEPRREAGCGIGARLRDARERAGLTIEQAAQRLRVSSEALEALEAERFDALGAPIYVKSYLLRYAELLGESPDALQAQLASTAAMPAPDLTRIPHARTEGGRYTAVILIAAGVLLVGGLVWWGWSSRRALEAVAVSMPATVQQRLPARVAAPAAHGAPPSVASTAHGTPSSAAPPAATATLRPSAVVPAAAKGAVRITLQFPAVSWVSVSDATGRRLYRGTVSAGATRTFTGPAPLHVVLGYATGVTLSVNGHAASIGSYVGRDHAVSIAVGASGRLSPVPWDAGE